MLIEPFIKYNEICLLIKHFNVLLFFTFCCISSGVASSHVPPPQLPGLAQVPAVQEPQASVAPVLHSTAGIHYPPPSLTAPPSHPPPVSPLITVPPPVASTMLHPPPAQQQVVIVSASSGSNLRDTYIVTASQPPPQPVPPVSSVSSVALIHPPENHAAAALAATLQIAEIQKQQQQQYGASSISSPNPSMASSSVGQVAATPTQAVAEQRVYLAPGTQVVSTSDGICLLAAPILHPQAQQHLPVVGVTSHQPPASQQAISDQVNAAVIRQNQLVIQQQQIEASQKQEQVLANQNQETLERQMHAQQATATTPVNSSVSSSCAIYTAATSSSTITTEATINGGKMSVSSQENTGLVNSSKIEVKKIPSHSYNLLLFDELLKFLKKHVAISKVLKNIGLKHGLRCILLYFAYVLRTILPLGRKYQWKKPMYNQQQNKWFPQWCLLTLFEATFHFSRSELTFT